MCLCVYLSVSGCVFVFTCLSLDVSVCLPVCLYMCLCVYLSVSTCVCVFTCLSLHVSVCLPVCLWMCLCVYLSVSGCVCVFTCLSVCLSQDGVMFRDRWVMSSCRFPIMHFSAVWRSLLPWRSWSKTCPGVSTWAGWTWLVSWWWCHTGETTHLNTVINHLLTVYSFI